MDNLRVEDLALQRKRFAHLSDDEFRFMLQQVDGRQRTRDKLPTFAEIEDWWYPVRLSCEQCSSELTARYKAGLIQPIVQQPFTLVDLTGGYGVDTFFLSEYATEAHYVERNEELCRIVTHNFRQTRPQVQIHNTDSVDYLRDMPTCDIIYIDPARRDQHGGKVFRLEDCEPNVIDTLPTLRSKSSTIIIKLSPMLDITQALHSLKGAWDVHIVAVKNEVKEVLLVSHNTEQECHIHAVNLPNTDAFTFTQEEEKTLPIPTFADLTPLQVEARYGLIYEPNAAIIKAGAFKLVAKRYGLRKMAPNTHLYLSDQLVEDFHGRVWRIIATDLKKHKDIRANIMTRNYPLTPEQLRKKLKVKDSDTYTIIGARLGDKPCLFLAERIDQHAASR